MSSQESVPITIPATVVHRKFSEVIRRVYSGGEHFIGMPRKTQAFRFGI